jgi:hypothetical protein
MINQFNDKAIRLSDNRFRRGYYGWHPHLLATGNVKKTFKWFRKSIKDLKKWGLN